MYGSAPTPPSLRVCASAGARSSKPARSSPKMCPPAPASWAIPRKSSRRPLPVPPRMGNASANEAGQDFPAMNEDRTLAWDWHPGRVPENVRLDPGAYVETTYSFHLFRSRAAEAVRIERGASIYLGTMFDLGPGARVSVGAF